ncbi:MAG: chromosomal replication initiator protein DnaA [Endomicrobium sp.]|jgi:chromosomal replication initiator protein|uniref:chromosomal replication initiator protein DnaA n=1 Tax=Candidatus Endomicrobiellum cubanum TaxID=3242325 RepID=UPI00282D38F1|nr:chromosomal replication initiator protein DnaA [Endomicrobium sp.]
MSKVVYSIWEKVVDNIKLSVSSETYNLWIEPLKPLSFENNVFTLEVPNVYFSQWISKNQQKNIEQIISLECGNRVALEFKPQQDLAQVIIKSGDTPEHTDVNMPVQQSVVAQKDQINPKYVFPGFVVGASNRFAHGCCEAVAKNPGKQFNPLFMYSGVGLGKTHLLYAIGNYIKQSIPNSKVMYVTCEKFVTEFIESIRFDKVSAFKSKYRGLDCLLIDDIQFLMGKESSQEEFFHMFNNLFNSKKQVVVSSDRPPKELEGVEERLISRFEWGVIADIQPPDLETRIAILRKKAEEEKIYVPDDVVIYIVSQIKSNIRQLEGSLLRITAFSLFTGTPLTVDSVQKILHDIIKADNSARITIESIQQVVADEFNLDIKDMKSKRRTDVIAFPRQIAMYLARTLTDEFSTNAIGDAFGGRDHSTVMHACNKIKEKMDSDPYFNAKINQIIKKIRNI